MRVAPRKTTKHLGAQVPVRRPSGGVAQGDEPHGCGERRKGPGRPLCAGPRSGTGGREVWPQARPGCRGGLLFGYFILVGAAIRRQEKVTRGKGERGGVPVVWKINLSPLLQVFLARRATEPAYLIAAQLPSSAQGVSYAARECDAVESVCEGWTGRVADGGGNSEPWSGYLL